MRTANEGADLERDAVLAHPASMTRTCDKLGPRPTLPATIPWATAKSDDGDDMADLKFFEPVLISLRDRGLDERWVQDRLSEKPGLLGLGDLQVKDKERMQPAAGRLDLLLQDPDTAKRYEIEIQLGRTDETHVIRTIEYWDIERKRYPQYEHCAVIVAEEITGRFLNVISLFNGFIPLVALRMQAFVVNDGVGLIFTKVLDEVQLGLVDEDEDVQEPTDRGYWEEKGSPKTVSLADRVVEMIRTFAPGYELKFNKHYIGLARDGSPDNFVIMRPQRNALRVEPKLAKSDEMTRRVEEAGIEVLAYDSRYGRYKIRLSADDIEKNQAMLIELMKQAQTESQGA
jgi:hypothetical protein